VKLQAFATKGPDSERLAELTETGRIRAQGAGSLDLGRRDDRSEQGRVICSTQHGLAGSLAEEKLHLVGALDALVVKIHLVLVQQSMRALNNVYIQGNHVHANRVKHAHRARGILKKQGLLGGKLDIANNDCYLPAG